MKKKKMKSFRMPIKLMKETKKLAKDLNITHTELVHAILKQYISMQKALDYSKAKP